MTLYYECLSVVNISNNDYTLVRMTYLISNNDEVNLKSTYLEDN